MAAARSSVKKTETLSGRGRKPVTYDTALVPKLLKLRPGQAHYVAPRSGESLGKARNRISMAINLRIYKKGLAKPGTFSCYRTEDGHIGVERVA